MSDVQVIFFVYLVDCNIDIPSCSGALLRLYSLPLQLPPNEDLAAKAVHCIGHKEGFAV